ncbi:MAG: hypothetical protein OEX83_10445 [Gammaproteobacteria bacterium]|nr:hypothetical protein [Gammaproteobacteria bacterium]
MGLRASLGRRLSAWLNQEQEAPETPLCDFDRITYDIRPADVILVEGRSRVSNVIRIITQSSWTHSVLYIGRIHDIMNPELRERVSSFYQGDPNEQLVIEAILGAGTIVVPLSKYKDDHLRLCRARGLTPQDAQEVIAHSIGTLGSGYDMRQLLDLARFMLPYTLIPRRWRSSLFEHNPGDVTSTVCSTMIAKAFMQVKFPLLPIAFKNEDGTYTLHHRNPKLFTPRDFDYSPYFDIIKFPIWDPHKMSRYQNMPWDTKGLVCNKEGDCFIPSDHPAAAKDDETPLPPNKEKTG